MEKRRFNLSLPEHIAQELERYSAPLSSNPTEYAGLIVRKWYADGCPPVTPEESRLREAGTAIKPVRKSSTK
jgi:hypothetical protein